MPLHRPVFAGNERQYLVDCIDSTFVSSVGEKVTEFEQRVAVFTGVRHAVATVNGTAALHVALQLAGVGRDDEVITQALTFIATCNAIRYCGAQPVFVDVDRDTLSMSPAALKRFLDRHAERRHGQIFNTTTGRRLAACVPMHTFGHPCRIEEIVALCAEHGIPVVEDAAESLGTPCVTTDVGDAALIVGDTGWVVPPSQPEALADAIIRALQARRDEAAWAVRCAAARSRIQENFSIEKMVQAYGHIWEIASNPLDGKVGN